MRKLLRWSLLVFGLVAMLSGALFVMAPAQVPATVIAHAVKRDPALLARAWALPVARRYAREPYFQTNGSLCGPATLLNVFASRGERFSDESAVVAGTGKCWTGYCLPGLTLDELANIARARSSAKVTVLRDLTPAQFEEQLRRSNDPSRRYTINFTRHPIFGGGSGHHSPIAGYLEPEQLVLVIDVNQAYRPWLIERDRLFAAMDTVDSSTQKKRGMLLLE